MITLAVSQSVPASCQDISCCLDIKQHWGSALLVVVLW